MGARNLKTDKSNPADFDDIVIGSSPMMLLQAGMLAREGRNVCLLEREGAMGGSWQTAKLDNGDEVEIACHLIEVFPGIYEFLEGASGVPFEALDAQPIRVHRNGFTVPYFSKMLMLASGARLFIGYGKERLKVALGRTDDRNRLINFQKKLSSYLRHQGPSFFQRPIMQGPKYGFVDFMERLMSRTRTDGVTFKTFDVSAMARGVDGLWHLNDLDGNQLSSEHVHCTTSSNLRPISAGRFEAAKQEFAHRLCVVAEVENEVIKISQTYVAFWNNPAVARISRIDVASPQAYQRFLIEFHDHDLARQQDWHLTVRHHMELAKIIEKGGAYQVVGQVNCLFTTNVDQLPSGKIDTNLWGYYSMGNLAAGLAAWRKTERIPKLTRSSTMAKTA